MKATDCPPVRSSAPFIKPFSASIRSCPRSMTFQPGGILTRAQISKIIWLLRSL
ncbi:MAG: hypothetical protein IJS31_05530 [Oscillospiraceae bacterium]|nr:hypothetical protein [Oscillospiraceae bacterium]